MQEFTSNNIRNVALIGHGGDGKTTLCEAILFNAGAIDRQGKVDDGNTVMDFDPESIAKKISIGLSVANCIYKNIKINLIDTPGFFDFEAEFRQAMSVCESAVVVCGASGVLSVGSEKALDYCIENNVPCIIFINGMDKENANYIGTVKALQDRYSTKIAPMQIPYMVDAKMKGTVDIVSGKLFEFASNSEGKPIPDGLKAQYEEIRSKILETAAESSDELMEKFFSGEELSQQEIQEGIKLGVKTGSAIPVFAGSALANKGVFNLMDEIITYALSPLESKPVSATNEQDNAISLAADSNGPLVLRVFKTIADPFVGRLSLLKVVSGTLRSGAELYNSVKEGNEKVGTLYFIRGKKQENAEVAYTGDIVALAKLSDVTTGDTLCPRNFIVKLAKAQMPEPVLSMAVYAAKKGDEDKIFNGLNRLKDEDISFTVSKNLETGEMLISGVGETQLDVLCRKLKNKFGAEAMLTEPRIAYRETIKKTVEQEGKHKKQSGGAGQYGHCKIRFSPGAADGVFEFVDEVVGGSVPKQYIPSVEKGLLKAIKKGVLAGYPTVNLKAALIDGSSHPVDSKDIAYQSAAEIAYRDGLVNADPVILEPIYSVRVVVPESYMGDILGDMNKRRGRILGMEMQGNKQVINAEAPLSEMLKYATDLRSMTQGRGSFSRELLRYEQVPNEQVAKIIENAKKWQEESKSE